MSKNPNSTQQGADKPRQGQAMDTLVFIDESFTPNLLRKLTSQTLKLEHCQFLTLDEATFFSLQSMGYQICFLQDLMEADEQLNLEAQYLDIVRTVFFGQSNFGVSFQYNGVQLGQMIQDGIEPYFVRIYRNIFCVKKALDLFSYKRIAIVGVAGLTSTARLLLDSMGKEYLDCKGSILGSFGFRLRQIIKERSNRWLRIPFREFVYDPLQVIYVVLDSLVRNKLLRLNGEGYINQKKNLIVCSVDRHSLGGCSELIDTDGWEMAGCGLDMGFKRANFGGRVALEGSLGPRELSETLAAIAGLWRLWLSLDDNKKFTSIFEHEGFNYWQLIRGTIRGNMLIVFPYLYLVYTIAQKFFIQHTRSFLVIPSGRPAYYRALAFAAKNTATKSLIIQHGILTEFDCNKVIESSYFAAWGQKELDWFSEHLSQEQLQGVYVTGRIDPELDLLLKPDEVQAKLQNDYGVPKERKIIMVFTQWVRSQYLPFIDMHDFKMIDAVVRAAAEVSAEGIHVIVKPHPTGDTQLLRDFCADMGKEFWNITMVPGNIGNITSAADLCVSLPPSTVVLEAMIHGKPTIVFDRYIKREIIPFVRMGASMRIEDGLKMKEIIKLWYHDPSTLNHLRPKAQQYLKYALHKPDGLGGKRVSALIASLAEGQKPERFC
ncbi:hypothetical protein ACFLZI_02025 [Nitrospirota bacterium]